jgi:hypothetical protein
MLTAYTLALSLLPLLAQAPHFPDGPPNDEASSRAPETLIGKRVFETLLTKAVGDAVESELRKIGITSRIERDLLALIDKHFERPAPPKTHFLVYFVTAGKQSGADSAKELRSDDGSSLRFLRMRAPTQTPLAVIARIAPAWSAMSITEKVFTYDAQKGWQIMALPKKPTQENPTK